MTPEPIGTRRAASRTLGRAVAIAAATATMLTGAVVATAAMPAAGSPSLGSGQPEPPDDLGDDEELDALAEECYDGTLKSCDLLFLHSPAESEYETYGDTYRGRQEAETELYCELGRDEPLTPAPPDDTATVEQSQPADPVATTEPAATSEPDPSTVTPSPPTDLGTDATLDALAAECYAGDMEACDDLYFAADPDSPYRIYGDTCAGRQPEGTGKICTLITDPVPGTDGPTTEPETTAADTTPATSTTIATTTTSTAPPGPVLTEPAEPAPPVSIPADTAPVTVGPETTPPTTEVVPTVPSIPTVPPESTVADVIPPATQSPVGLGTDPALDALAQDCFYGAMEACDELFRQTEDQPDLNAYLEYADTCAGRQELGTGEWCVNSFPGSPGSTTTTVPGTPTLPTVPPTSTTSEAAPTTTAPGEVPAGEPPTGLGTDPELDALAQSCYDGDMASCDTLFDTAPIGSPYHTYGDTCAGRQPPGTFKYCRIAFPQS